jgi:superfamily I DNA/RNA helicase
MELTGGQRAVVAHGNGPGRVFGGFGTGKTTALAARVDRLAGDAGADRVLAITQTHGSAAAFRRRLHHRVPVMTFWDLAGGILQRVGQPAELIGSVARRSLVAELLAAEGRRQWPTLHRNLVDPGFAEELADTVCSYEASFLGLEELRTHARAAAVPERWEEVAAFTDRYREALAAKGMKDWAGLLVDAALALRDDGVLDLERSRFDHVVVDDFEATSFATNRLLLLLTGPGSNVVVAGNPVGPGAPGFGSSPAFLADFDRRFDAELDTTLESRLRPAAASALVLCQDPAEETEGVAAELETVHREDGLAWNDMAVVVCRWESDADGVFEALTAAGVPAQAGQGPDPWDASTPATGDAVTVVSIDGAVGREWDTVVLTGCVDGILPTEPRQHRWFDSALLTHGPDVPEAADRAIDWRAGERRRFDLAVSRARSRMVLVAAPPKGGAISPFVEGVRGTDP